MVECPPRVWEVVSSIPDRVIPKTIIKMVVVTSLLGVQGCVDSTTTGWPVPG